MLLPAIVAFTRRFARVRISVLQGAPEQVAELVREGKVTIGVTHLPPQLPKEIVAVPFLTSHRALVTRVGHPLLKKKNLTLEELAPYPIIVQHSSRPQGARILRKFQQAGFDVNIVVQALDADVVKTYVAAGLGIGIIPAFSYSAREDRGLRVRDVGHLFDDAVSAGTAAAAKPSSALRLRIPREPRPLPGASPSRATGPRRWEDCRMKFVDGSHVSPHSFCHRPDAARCGAGLEVFLLKRDGLSDVLGGAYVFPRQDVPSRRGACQPPRPACWPKRAAASRPITNWTFTRCRRSYKR